MRKSTVAWLLAFLLAVSRPALAQSPPSLGPYLQFETGQHIQLVNALALLPGNALISVSDDHTARIWSQDRLAQQAVLRPPVGPEDQGKLYAVAAAGGLIALGGVIPDGNGAFSVHVYALAPKLHWIGLLAPLPSVRTLRFSPDGRYLAVGFMGGAGLLVYDMGPVLNGGKGAPVPVLADLPPDSAVTGLRSPADAAVIDTVRINSGYLGDVTGMDFDAGGRLVVAAGGRMRLYDEIARKPPRLASGSLDVRSVAFSPDGSRIVASDLNDGAIRLLDARSLRVIQSLRGRPDNRGVFIDAAFSPDGETVFAAGTYKDASGRYFIRHWPLHGGVAGDWAAAENSILTLLPVNGGVVFGSADPAVGRFDLDGRMAALQRSPLIDFRDAGLKSFRISPDAATIDMPGADPSSILRFDMRQRRLTAVDGNPAGLLAPLELGPGLVMTDWRNSHTPRLNGGVIALEPNETARAVAVSPSGNGVALGTDFYLRFETASGEAWRIPTPAAVWAVDISADGRLIVAALADGSVRWYDTTAHPTASLTADNSQFQQERLGLLVDPSPEEERAPRWVLWTPLGFFDHDRRSDGAPDGRELIGYLINLKSWHRARFVQIGQMYQTFFRPDLVDLAFRGQVAGPTAIPGQKPVQADIGKIIAAPPPPTITLTDICGHDPQSQATGCPTDVLPGDHRTANDLTTKADAVTVIYKIQGPAGHVGSVILQRDGAVIRPDIFVDDEDTKSRTEEATILLGSGVNDIQLTPVNAEGAVQGSTTEILRLRVTHLADHASDAKALAPDARLYMLGVGISRYDQSQLDLANAAHDAQAMAALMGIPAPPIYVQPVVTTLIDSEATTQNIVNALKTIASKAQPDDLVVIFMAGHGQQVNGQYYFASVDFGTHDPALFNRAMNEGNDTAEHAVDTLFANEGLGQETLLPLIESIKASHVALILDTCYSAAIATEDAVLMRDMNETVANRIGDSIGRFVLSSSFNLALDTGSAGLTEVPVDQQGHGLFTEYVLQALRGKADFMHRGQVDIDDLAKYTQQSVEAATSEMSQPQQPAYYFSGSDFFAMRTAP